MSAFKESLLIQKTNIHDSKEVEYSTTKQKTLPCLVNDCLELSSASGKTAADLHELDLTETLQFSGYLEQSKMSLSELQNCHFLFAFRLIQKFQTHHF